MRRTATGLALLAAVVVVVAQLGLRFGLSHNVDQWHVDPLEVQALDSDNFDLVVPPEAPVFSVPAAELADVLAVVMGSLARTDQLASNETPSLTTWVTKSLLWSFPDYTSIRVVSLNDETSTLAIFARARFGQSDLGVNADRNAAILAALQTELERK